MKILVISDVHSNLAALNAVIQDAGAFDQVWCLGDVVGYGPEPNECIARLRAFDLVCLAGNHDLAAVGKLSPVDFGPEAREVIFWTHDRLSIANHDWLTSLPTVAVRAEHGITLVHGSPRDPTWEYVMTPAIANAGLELMPTRIGLNGHTHVPIVFRKPTYEVGLTVERLEVNLAITLTRDRLLINPGSVGQPRDDDPRAAYALIDLSTMTFTQRRVQYDVNATQALMKLAQLPSRLRRRLRFGQ